MEYQVEKNDLGKRIDKYLTERVDQTRSAICILLEKGAVTVNGVPVQKNYKVRENDCVSIEIPPPVNLEVTAENIPLDIVYEDSDLLVVNKPQGMVVHPAAGNYHGTLVNALLYHCRDSLSEINGVIRPGIVHRIDKDTSGLLIVAKTNAAHLGLAEQIKQHSFLRVYNGFVYGRLKQSSGTINKPIGRHPTDRKKMAITEKNAKNAVTHYKLLEEYRKGSLVEFTLETGRTHQIRVHMSSIGHAIISDPLYRPKNAETFGYEGQFLHAKKIGFIHPVRCQYLEFDSDLPSRFAELTEKLK